MGGFPMAEAERKESKKGDASAAVVAPGNNPKFRSGSKALNLLRRFVHQEKVSGKREAVVVANEKVLAMERAFEKILKVKNYFETGNGRIFLDIFLSFSPGADPKEERRDSLIGKLLGEIKKMDYTARDVEEFLEGLGKYQPEKNFANRAGLFISDLVNQCKDEKFHLNVRHLDVLVNYLGYHNTKTVWVSGSVGDHAFHGSSGWGEIDGDAGNFAGAYSSGGRLHLKGNALDYFFAYGNGGRGIADGDVRDCAGRGNRGADVIIHGHARHETGAEQEDGSIHVGKSVRDFTGRYQRGGSIFVEWTARFHTSEGRTGGLVVIRNKGPNSKLDYWETMKL